MVGSRLADVLPTHKPFGSTGASIIATSGGRFFSHRHVRFRHGSPNIYGSMIWLYLGSPNTDMGTGFSIAMRAQALSQMDLKNRAAFQPFSRRSWSAMVWSALYNRTAPAAVR